MLNSHTAVSAARKPGSIPIYSNHKSTGFMTHNLLCSNKARYMQVTDSNAPNLASQN
jgi:hypothetical protein